MLYLCSGMYQPGPGFNFRLTASDSFDQRDADILRQLSVWTNVIPVIAKSDVSSEEEIRQLRQQVQTTLADSKVKAFTFGAGEQELTEGHAARLSQSNPAALFASSVSVSESTLMTSLGFVGVTVTVAATGMSIGISGLLLRCAPSSTGADDPLPFRSWRPPDSDPAGCSSSPCSGRFPNPRSMLPGPKSVSSRSLNEPASDQRGMVVPDHSWL